MTPSERRSTGNDRLIGGPGADQDERRARRQGDIAAASIEIRRGAFDVDMRTQL